MSRTYFEIGKALLGGSFKRALSVVKKLQKKKIPEESIRIATSGFFTAKLSWCKTEELGDRYSAVLDIITEPIPMHGKPAYHKLVNYLYKASRIMRN